MRNCNCDTVAILTNTACAACTAAANCLGCLEGRHPHAIDCPHRDDDWRRDEHSMRVDVLAARRQERVDSLAGGGPPPVWDEAGTVDVRLLCGVAAVAVLALVVWLAWPYIVGGGVIFAAWRVVTRHTRRRRPRSSWSSLGRTAALMYASWNSRWLKGVSPVRVSVPRKAAGPVDDRGRFACDVDDNTIPF